MSDSIQSDTVLLITRDGMGSGDLALQRKLINTYLALLNDSETLPGAICFYTEGVRLVVAGSPVLEALHALQAKGVHLILCATCLDHYGLLDQVEVGIIGGMTDIIEAQWRARKVITL